MGWIRPTAGDVAEEISRCLGEGDEDSARRLAFRFIEHFDKAGPDRRVEMVSERPGSTGDKRFDALLPGIVEVACASNDTVPPGWANDEDLFLDEFWFVSGMRSLHANALVHSPISLARRGVFVAQGSLTYA